MHTTTQTSIKHDRLADFTRDTRILVLTSFTNDSFIYDAITSGAQGYLMKEIDPQGLVQAIHDIAAGKSILSPDVMAGVMPAIPTRQAPPANLPASPGQAWR